ncbi:MAG: B12-binding domain-containing radical SAM protein [Candidatus Micrarchaeia archaeon]
MVDSTRQRRKILLLNPPGDKLYLRDGYCCSSSKADYYWAPIDLLVLSGILSEKHEVSVLDANVLMMGFDEAFEKISKMDFDTLIFLTASPSWNNDFKFIERLKKSKNFTAIASGGFLLFLGEKFMKRYSFLDAILLEFTSRDVMDYLDGKLGVIPNMIIRRNDELLIGLRKCPLKFEIPTPRHELFPIKHYRLSHAKRLPLTTVITSQGCPYSCTFCIGALVGFRDRPNENTMMELRHIQELGIKEVFFKDFTFTLNRAKIIDLCKRMIDEKIDLTWSALTRVHLLDDELLDVMKRAGCHTLMLGVESGNNDLLKRYSKGINRDQIKKGFALCKKHGVITLAHFIIGLPGETKETALQTIEFAKEIDPDYASFNIALPLVGSPLREEALKNKWCTIDTELFDASLSEPTMETPELSKKEAARLRNKAIIDFYLRPSFILKKILDLRSFGQLKQLIGNGFSLIKNVFF